MSTETAKSEKVRVMLKCGCAAQGVRTATNGVKHDPIPCCIVHDCIEVAESLPDLTGRTARCTYRSCKQYLAKYRDTHYGELRTDGRSYAPSSLKLPFFKHKPTEEYDEYFCGCMGWD
jgi:hypothetical protein